MRTLMGGRKDCTNRRPAARATVAPLAATLAAAAGLLLCCGPSPAAAAGKMYDTGHKVELWVASVGPYANPQESYEYYSLPYCAPDNEHHPSTGSTGLFNTLKATYLGEALGGHSLRHTGHDLVFPDQDGVAGAGELAGAGAGGVVGSLTYEPAPVVEECTKTLTAEEAGKFAAAADGQWFYLMYLDDLPVWGLVGEMMSPAEVARAGEGGAEAGGQASDLQQLEMEAAARGRGGGSASDGSDLRPYVYTDRTLTVDYNGGRVVMVDLVSEPASLVEVAEGASLNFRMTIKWRKSNATFHSRFDRYLDHQFFKHQIHWFSLFNSFMMVLFLAGLVSLILLRTLRKDYARYSMNDLELGEDDGEDGYDSDGRPLIDRGGGGSAEEAGWKQVHGDVFRAPRLLTLFSAILGTGAQLAALILGVVLFAVAGPLHGEVHEERGEVLHAILWCYALSSVVAGYTSGSYFKRYFATTVRARGGTKAVAGSVAGNSASVWQATMFLTVVLLPTVLTVILSFLNLLSLVYGTINYIPFLVILKVFLIYVFVSVPLTIVGTLVGRHAKVPGGGGKGGKGGKGGGGSQPFPCRVNAIPRPIPDEGVPWYGRPLNVIPCAGLLSFASIFIELYYILTSLWNYKYYHVYGFLLGVYGILALVVGLTSVIAVYFTLNAENYLWQWTSFASGASISVYVFLYGAYYFAFKTAMTGLYQSCYYFGLMTVLSLILGLVCGTLGHFAAGRFVRAVFSNVKVD